MRGAYSTAAMFATSASRGNFKQRRARVQSAVNTRTKEINEIKKENQELDNEGRRHQLDLDEVKRRNEELMQMIRQRQQQQLTQQFD